MIIQHGHNIEELVELDVTLGELEEIAQTSLIVKLLSITEKDIDENGHFIIPQGVTHIGEWAFRSCKELTSIDISQGVTHINRGAFYDCTELTSMNISQRVTHIDDWAFFGCTGLTSIDIPQGVTHISDGAFRGCTGLTNIDIPQGVTYIGDWAFRDCTGLTSIDIPQGVTHVGAWAFYGCTGLTSLVIPVGVTYIGVRAFSNCSSLISLAIPAGVTYIGYCAFSGCRGLSSLVIPDEVTYIADRAFEECSGLTSISIPQGVTDIGMDVFYDCPNLKDILIDSDDINEIERIKALLPEEHQNKVIMKSVFDESNRHYQETKTKLMRAPQFNPMYLLSDYIVSQSLGDPYGEISSYLKEEEISHPLFKRAIQKIDAIPKPKTRLELVYYKRSLSYTLGKYTELANKIKPSLMHQFFLAAKDKGSHKCYKKYLLHSVLPKLEEKHQELNKVSLQPK